MTPERCTAVHPDTGQRCYAWLIGDDVPHPGPTGQEHWHPRHIGGSGLITWALDAPPSLFGEAS